MTDKKALSPTDIDWQNKYQSSQADLRDKEKQWQDTDRLLRLLLSRLTGLVTSQDNTLNNNLQILRKALREGQDILQLNRLIKDISDRILVIESTELKSTISAHGDTEDRQLELISDVFLVLLENINFPSAFKPQIDRIKITIDTGNSIERRLRLLAGITALAEVLDDIFYDVKHDKQKLGLFLQQINSELKSLDEGMLATHELHTRKQAAGDAINSKLESEVQEMENVITTQLNLDAIKSSVQSSVNTIRQHMDTFKQQEQQHNQQAKMVTESLRRRLSSMEKQCVDLKKQLLEKHRQVLSDPLTGIRNRIAYEEAIINELERFKRYNRSACLLMLDLDKFKHINDTYGHNIGDKVLQFVVRILSKNIRSVDFLARYGGEEFVVILPELDLSEAKKVAQKICKTIEASKLEVDGHTIKITISGGVARFRDGDTAESLFERADTALYLAKERGRNRCETE